jgi:hypothetical protein
MSWERILDPISGEFCIWLFCLIFRRVGSLKLDLCLF